MTYSLENNGPRLDERVFGNKWVEKLDNYKYLDPANSVDTTIPVKKRLQTIESLHVAGLSLSTRVEPIGLGHTPRELTEATRMSMERREALS